MTDARRFGSHDRDDDDDDDNDDDNGDEDYDANYDKSVKGDQDYNMAAVCCPWITCATSIHQTQVLIFLLFFLFDFSLIVFV